MNEHIARLIECTPSIAEVALHDGELSYGRKQFACDMPEHDLVQAFREHRVAFDFRCYACFIAGLSMFKLGNNPKALPGHKYRDKGWNYWIDVSLEEMLAAHQHFHAGSTDDSDWASRQSDDDDFFTVSDV